MAIQTSLSSFMRALQNNTHEYQPQLLECSKYINAYEIDQAYGGSEEGGWWFTYGIPLASTKVRTKADAIRVFDIYLELYDEYDNGIDMYSVISEGDLVIYIEDEPGKEFPSERPHYE